MHRLSSITGSMVSRWWIDYRLIRFLVMAPVIEKLTALSLTVCALSKASPWQALQSGLVWRVYAENESIRRAPCEILPVQTV